MAGRGSLGRAARPIAGSSSLRAHTGHPRGPAPAGVAGRTLDGVPPPPPAWPRSIPAMAAGMRADRGDHPGDDDADNRPWAPSVPRLRHRPRRPAVVQLVASVYYGGQHAVALLLCLGRVRNDGRPDADPASSRVPPSGHPSGPGGGVGVDPALGGSGSFVDGAGRGSGPVRSTLPAAAVATPKRGGSTRTQPSEGYQIWVVCRYSRNGPGRTLVLQPAGCVWPDQGGTGS